MGYLMHHHPEVSCANLDYQSKVLEHPNFSSYCNSSHSGPLNSLQWYKSNW